MRTLFWIMLLAFCCLVSANASYYVPIDTANVARRKSEAENYDKINKQYIENNFSSYKRGERFFLKKKLEAHAKFIKEEMLKGEYIFDNRIDSLISNILARLIQCNPDIPKDLHFYIKRDIALNAYSLGNSRFIMNIGSFYFLENEEQLASVISHEVSHFMLKHSELDLLHQYALNHSDELEEAVDDLYRNKNNKGEKATNKLKEILYSNGEKNKGQELQADSMGYVLYHNAKYSPAEYLKSLKLMAMYDTIHPKGLESSTYKKLFDLPKQPFNEAWLKREDFSAYDYSKYKEKFNLDSLKDHPDTEIRIRALEKRFPEIVTVGDTLPRSKFETIQNIASNEIVPSLFILEEYGGGIYICMQHLQKDSENIYYRKWLGKLLAKTAKARKDYTLNRYLDRIDPKNQSDSYQQFLSFMWNLSLIELTNLAEYYTEKDS